MPHVHINQNKKLALKPNVSILDMFATS